MPLIVTPRQLTQRSELYHQLGQLTAVGVGPLQALEHLRRNPPARSFREPLEQSIKHVAQGHTFSEAMSRSGDWLSSFDLALLRAGEQSGRLDAVFKVLANYYSDRARVAKRLIADLAYPVFLFHFLVFVMALVLYFWYPRLCLLPFGALALGYAFVAGLIYAAQSRHGETWRGLVESVLHPLPVLGTGRRYLAVARLATALEALISAGVTIIEAWEMAAAACGSPALQRTVLAWRPLLNAGQTPAEVLDAASGFPDLFINQYATGEISGKLDETLDRLHAYYQDEGSRKLQAVARWVPILIYLLVMIVIGIFVVWFWLTYYGRIFDAI